MLYLQSNNKSNSSRTSSNACFEEGIISNTTDSSNRTLHTDGNMFLVQEKKGSLLNLFKKGIINIPNIYLNNTSKIRIGRSPYYLEQGDTVYFNKQIHSNVLNYNQNYKIINADDFEKLRNIKLVKAENFLHFYCYIH